MVARNALVLAMLVACGGGKRPAGEDAMRSSRDGSAAVIDGSAGSAAPIGEAAIRVEWKAVPTTARQSPGRTACNTPRAPAVAPTTMWGIPDAFVLTDKAAPPGEVRIVLADCSLAPRIAIASTLVVESAVDRPTKVVLSKQGTIAALAALKPIEPRVIQLPIAGHGVTIALEPGVVYQLAVDGGDGEIAWLVNAPGMVTDPAGLATLKLPVGAHQVTAWLPARAGQEARVIKSTVTVEANALAELAIDLGPR